MASSLIAGQPDGVASKVLRRAQVSKMTRVLQDRLALANIKIKHGWQHRSIDSIEPELEQELKRKRSDSNGDVISDISTSGSERNYSTGILSSSPLTAPVFSDEPRESGGSRNSSKRFKSIHLHTSSFSRRRHNGRSSRPASLSWKASHQLPQSSPISRNRVIRPSLSDFHTVSFASETSTIPDDPASPSASEDDDGDLPVHSFQFPSNPQITSSPPRTPPPGLARSARLRSKTFSSPPSEHTAAGKEGADLLLYLAASPSPAMRVTKTDMFPPSTPPAKTTPLPSSMMSTPGGQMFLGFGPNTPGGFNFGDFVNVTPSPAQATWVKTPGTAKTPLTGRDTRRRINFDALVPPSGSPAIGSASRHVSKGTGLGMELGGELVT